MRPILIVGGAPRLTVDAVRYLSVRAGGATAKRLRALLAQRGAAADLLLGPGEAAGDARRYDDRAGLEEELRAWIARRPEGVVVMSAAVNDYQVAGVESVHAGVVRAHAPGTKVPSGADELVIRLRPASKLIDQLRPRFGLRGPIVGFKYEDAATVEASARRLLERVGAAVVLANSLCGSVQALVDAQGIARAPDRDAVLRLLADRVAALARPAA